MPEKRRIRRSSATTERQSGLIQGKAPHREQNAHKVLAKWPYYRAALMWFLVLGLLSVAVAALGFGLWQKDGAAVFVGIVIFIIWIFMRLMFFFASKATKCPLCRVNHFVNGKSVKHKKAYKVFPLSYSSTAVITIALNRCLRCMHCGVSFDLTKKYR